MAIHGQDSLWVGIFTPMSTHTIEEAQANLAELIDRARNGEEVVIMREGRAVARLNGIPQAAPKPITQEAIDWLDRNRVGSVMPDEDAGAFVSRMRDEDWAR
jgi:prevent-host-death family protein